MYNFKITVNVYRSVRSAYHDYIEAQINFLSKKSENFKLQCWVTKVLQTKDEWKAAFQYEKDLSELPIIRRFVRKILWNKTLELHSAYNVILILRIKPKYDLILSHPKPFCYSES